MTKRLWSFVRNVFSRRTVERALDDEMRACLEILIEQKVSQGMSTNEARRASLIELGGVEQLKEGVRWSRSGALLEGLRQDLGYALRRVVREPGFTAIAIVILALATGPVMAITGVANWLFLRPLPGVRDASRLLSINFGVPRGDRGGYTVSFVSPSHVALMAAASPALSGMAGWQPTGVAIAVPGQVARETRGEYVSPSYFDVLGVRLLAGRPFRPDEVESPASPIVVVVGAGLARRLFADSNPVGKTLNVGGATVTVMGVAPPAFGGMNRTQPAEIWIPGVFSRRLAHRPSEQWVYPADEGPYYMHVGRLASDATRDRANVELTRAALALSQTDPSARKFGSVKPLIQDGLPGPARSFRTVFAILFGAGVVLVLLAAANLANLFVFRAIRRAHESAVRRALGASWGRLARLHLIEALVVAAPGVILGILIAVFLKTWIGDALFAGRVEAVLAVDWRLVTLAISMATIVAVLLGTLPARLASRVEVKGVLGRFGRTATRQGARLRTSLAVVQLALSLTLLVGALLFTTTLRNLRAIDPGFDPTNVLVLNPRFTTQGYRSERVTDYYRELLARAARLPGVAALAIGDGTPLSGGGVNSTVIPFGKGRESEIDAFHVFVTPQYFAALGIGLAGETFDSRETLANVPEVSVIVSRSLANRLFGEEAAVGRTILIPEYNQAPHPVRVVGIAEDVRFDDLLEAPREVLYRPRRLANAVNNLLFVRASGEVAEMGDRLRGMAAEIDPTLPLDLFALQEVVDRETGPQRLFAWSSSALSILGFILAGVGIYGLVSQTVIERTREFGIRLAIGAGRWRIVHLVSRSALMVAAIGGPLGIGLAAASARLVENSLFGVRSPEPAMYGFALGTLVAVVLAASAIPGWLASRVNPVDVMRAE